MTGQNSRRGIVLVTVLWTIALISALAMAAATTFRGGAGIIALDRDRTRAGALLDAGLEAAANVVTNLDDQPLIEREIIVSLATGSVHVAISDDAGRVNINKAPVPVLVGLLRAIGAADDANGIAKAIDAWRVQDKGDQPKAGQALPNANAAAAAQPAGIAQKPDDGFLSFSDIRQLAQIPGMEPEYLAALMPLATVFGDDKVNGLTAPADVLAALPNMNAGRVSAFLAARQHQPVTEGRLQQILGPASDNVKLGAPPIARVELSARLLDGYSAAATAVIVVVPQDQQPYRVLKWTPMPSSARRNAITADTF